MVCIFYKNNSISFFFYYLLTLGAATPLSGLARHPGHLAADANKQHISSSPSACAIRPVEAHTRICQSPAQMPLPPSSPRSRRSNVPMEYHHGLQCRRLPRRSTMALRSSQSTRGEYRFWLIFYFWEIDKGFWVRAGGWQEYKGGV